jgi:uncharacterized protein
MRLAWLIMLALALPRNMAMAQSTPPVILLSVGSHQIEAEVAATPVSRDKGLRHRTLLPANRGMLFIFPEERTYCMWMRNTTIPLSVAFIDTKGTIVNIAEMPPATDDYYCSDKLVRYALEMNSGWFLKNGVTAGTRIQDIYQAPPGR